MALLNIPRIGTRHPLLVPFVQSINIRTRKLVTEFHPLDISPIFGCNRRSYHLTSGQHSKRIFLAQNKRICGTGNFIPGLGHQIMSAESMGCCKISQLTTHRNVKNAGIIIIGDEILKGQVMDTNSHFICKKLYSYGVKVSRISVIGDGINEIAKEVKKFSVKFDYVITTGGIGPTHDDMTYVGVAHAFGEDVVEHEEMAFMVDKWLSNKGYAQDVLRKMTELPSSATLLFDPSRPSLSSFPIVKVRNIYIFPGIPQFLEKMFPRMEAVFRASDKNESCARTTFHHREIHVAKDELSITPEINKAVDKFKDHVTFGSYPVVDNLYFSTRLTMESLSPEYVQAAKNYLIELMPENSVVLNYDQNPVASASKKVYEIAADAKHELHEVVGNAVKIIENAVETYGIDNLCVCFNGGKDCTALLHLVHAVVQRKYPEENISLQSLYIRGENPFPEMELFIKETSERYKLKTWSYTGSIRDGLQIALQEHPSLKGVLMGTRRTDPSGDSLGYFQMTDNGWPQIMRISPMLDWSFSDVWAFLRSLTLAYCPLYDRGYTSIGNQANTVPNPALAIQTKDGQQKYRPAYTLIDGNAERTGRQ